MEANSLRYCSERWLDVWLETEAHSSLDIKEPSCPLGSIQLLSLRIGEY